MVAIGIAINTVATMISLERTKQGIFRPEHCLDEKDWTAQNIWNAIAKAQELLSDYDNNQKTTPSETCDKNNET